MADKSALLAGREERDLVVQGRAILEDQRDLLAQQLLTAIHRFERIGPQFDQLLERARHRLRRAVLRHGNRGLAGYRAATGSLPAPQLEPRNLSGALLLGEVVLEPGTASLPGQGWDITPELTSARQVFQELVALGVQVAALDNDIRRLCRVFSRTQRRVNALENVILPELTSRIRGIEQALDDAEREGVVRARLARGRRVPAG